MDTRTIKTVIITAVVTCFLMGALLWIADQGGTKEDNRSRVYDKVTARTYTDAEIAWVGEQARNSDQIIQIEISSSRVSPGWGEIYDRISEVTDSSFSGSVWDTPAPPVMVHLPETQQTQPQRYGSRGYYNRNYGGDYRSRGYGRDYGRDYGYGGHGGYNNYYDNCE